MTILDLPATDTLLDTDLLTLGLGADVRVRPAITEVSVVVDGTSARFRYTTTADHVEILVSAHRPVFVDGMWTEWVAEASGGAMLAVGGRRAEFRVDGLRSERTYHFIITLPSVDGEAAHQVVGTFDTTRELLALVA